MSDGALPIALQGLGLAAGAAAAITAAQADVIDAPYISAASLLSMPATRKVVRLLGYAAAGDGGVALYQRVASQPAHAAKFRSTDRYLPNGSTDNTNGGWWEISEPEVSVKMFGAKGDGSTDDTSAFVSAMVFCEAKGVHLRVAAGAYNLATWTTRNATFVALRGAGMGVTTIIGPKIIGTHFVKMTSGYVDIEGVKFTKFDHVIYSEAALNSVRIHRSGAKQNRSCFYRQADVTDYPASAVSVAELTDNDVELSGGFQVHGAVGQGVASGNTMRNVCRDTSIWTSDTPLYQTFGISFGDTDNNNSSVAQALTKDITVTGNTISGMYNDTPAGTFNTTNAIQVSAINAVVVGNVVSGMDANDLTNNEAIYCKAQNFIIAKNAIRGSKTSSTCIAVKGTLNDYGPRQKNSSVSGNVVSSIDGLCSNAITSFAGGWMDISDNIIDGMSVDSIKVLGDPYRVNVLDNAITDNAGLYAINFHTGSVTDCRVEGNTIDGMLATSGAMAPIRVVSNPKQLSSAIVTSGGSGYTSVPAVTISGGGGVATAQATVVGGAVVGVVINGSNASFTSVPTISFSGGGGSGAAATAVLSTGAVNDLSIQRNRIKWSPKSTLTSATGIFVQSDAVSAQSSGGFIVKDNDLIADSAATLTSILGVGFFSATASWCRDIIINGLNMYGANETWLKPVNFNSTQSLYSQSANYGSMAVNNVTINGVRRRTLAAAQIDDNRATFVVSLAGAAVGPKLIGYLPYSVMVTKALAFSNIQPASGTSAGKLAFSLGTSGLKQIMGDTLVTAFVANAFTSCIPDGTAANAKRAFVSSGRVPVYMDVTVEALTGGVITLILETEAIAF